LTDWTDLPSLFPEAFEKPSLTALQVPPLTHPPRILLLYGSLRERSYSRFLALEAARLLEALGAEARLFDPAGLPMPDSVPAIIRRCRSYANFRCGRKGRSGAAPSATAP